VLPWSSQQRNAVEAQRKHPLAYASLMLAALVPMVVGITGLGMFLKRRYPLPDALLIVAGAGVFIVMVPVLMCGGAGLWLLIARRIVPRSVAKAFFVDAGLGIISTASEWMFVMAYGEMVEERDAGPREPPKTG
jgi:hypothetical protein